MSIIKSVQSFLHTCPYIALRQIRLDGTEEDPSNCAVALAGNSKISEDLAGNKTYQYNFVFYVREYTGSEADKEGNHDFLQSFTDWIEDQDAAESYPTLAANCVPESMSVSNMLLFDVDPDGSAGLYQVQLKLIYTKER